MVSTTNNPAETPRDEFPEWMDGEFPEWISADGEMPYADDRGEGTPEFDE